MEGDRETGRQGDRWRRQGDRETGRQVEGDRETGGGRVCVAQDLPLCFCFFFTVLMVRFLPFFQSMEHLSSEEASRELVRSETHTPRRR